MQVYVKIKALGKRRDVLPPRPYELPEGIASLRQLLTASAEEIDARAASGKVGFGRLWSDRKADRAKAAETAVRAFQDGLVRVLMDEAELTELDAPLEVRDGAVFTFVRLTFLAGRMW